MSKKRQSFQVGGYVVGREPAAELAELRKILMGPRAKRSALLVRKLRASKQQAEAFAEKDLRSILEG